MYLNFRDAEQVAADLRAASAPEHRWLLCVADRHDNELPALLEACRTQGLRVCGALFPGLIRGSQSLSSGIVALPLPAGSQVALAHLDGDTRTWQAPLPDAEGPPFVSAILLVDCLAPNISGLLEEIYDRYGNRVHHVGAGAGYHDLRPAPVIFTHDGIFPHAALMVAMPHHLTLGVRHGWRRVAGPFVASRTRGNVIQELNWEPAGSFYRAQVGSQNPDLTDKPIFPDLNSTYPLCVAKEGSEDIMRDPVRISDADEVVVLSDVAENSLMYLATGNRDSLVQAARQAVEDCGNPDGVTFCFISDCYSRVLMLGDDFDRELDAMSQALANITDVEPVGVMALGEVAANGTQKLELFNKTFVVGLLHQAP